MVNDGERDLVRERPGHDAVVVVLHDDEEERGMRVLSLAIAVWIETGTAFVTTRTGVKRLAVDGDSLPALGLPPASLPIA